MSGKEATNVARSAQASRVLDFLASMPRYGNTTTDRKTVRNILLTTGGWIMAAGRQWDIRAKHLGAGVYRVTLEERL